MRRPVILGLLLAGNALTIAANAIIFDGQRHQFGSGLLPWYALLLIAATLFSVGWVCILVFELPDDAAAKLWPGFIAVGCAALLGSAGEWVLLRQYDDTLSLLHRIGVGGYAAPVSSFASLRVSLPAYQPDSDLALLIGGLVSAAAWFGWAVIARRQSVRLAAGAPVTQG